MVLLRDMLESDIEDYVRWFTVETEWTQWDAPWEPVETDEERERDHWTAFFHKKRGLDDNALRKRFEIELDGVHIGWVCWYTDLGYMENPDQRPVLGINIPAADNRSRGIGSEAVLKFIEYLRSQGYHAFYTQTWSGNKPMIRVAEKLGFREVCRVENYRQVRGLPYDAVTWELKYEEGQE